MLDGAGLGIPQSPMDMGSALSSIDGLATFTLRVKALMQIIMLALAGLVHGLLIHGLAIC